MNLDTIIAIGIGIGVVAFIIHCPILKPWFGFRRPSGSKGRWFS